MNKLVAILLVVAALSVPVLAPQVARAATKNGGLLIVGAGLLLTYFGGRIITLIPCVDVDAGWIVKIMGARMVPRIESYFYNPATAITYSAGPPKNPGQQVFGLAFGPSGCNIHIDDGKPTDFTKGKRILMIGTSAI